MLLQSIYIGGATMVGDAVFGGELTTDINAITATEYLRLCHPLSPTTETLQKSVLDRKSTRLNSSHWE